MYNAIQDIKEAAEDHATTHSQCSSMAYIIAICNRLIDDGK